MWASVRMTGYGLNDRQRAEQQAIGGGRNIIIINDTRYDTKYSLSVVVFI